MANLLDGFVALLTGRVGRDLRRRARSALLYGLVAGLLLTAWAAAVAAAFVALAVHWGALAAWGIIAAAALVLAGGLALITVQLDRVERRRAAAEAALLRQGLAAALALLPGLKSHPLLLIAALLGLTMGSGAAPHDPGDAK